MTLRDYLISQFEHPRGPVGWVVGWLLALKNRARNAWLIEIVDPQPRDRILEIGFGPGVTLAALAARVGDGSVAGLDHSAVMVAQARRRNRAAVAAGRMDVRLGSAASLPFDEGTFDKVCASNVNLFWADEVAALREINRVLCSQGRLVIALQPRWVRSEEEMGRTARELDDRFRAAGFVAVRVQRKPMQPVDCLCAIGQKE